MTRRAPTLSGLITVYAGGALLLLALVLGVVVQQVISHTLEGAMRDKAAALAQQLATVALDAVLIYDYGTLERYVNDLAGSPDVVHLRIRRHDGEILADSGRGVSGESAERFQVSVPMRLAGNTVGEVTVHYDRSRVERTVLWLSLIWLGGLLLFTVALFMVLKRLLRRRLVEPVQALAQRVHPLSEEGGAMPERGVTPPEEVRILADTFEAMRAEIREHIEEIEQANRLARTATERFCREQRLAFIGQMAAGLAHGLNTPLGNIIGYAQQGQRNSDGELRHRLEVIERQARKCSDTVRSLLTAARKPEIMPQRTDLRAVANATVELVRPVLRDHGAEVAVDRAGPCPVHCDVGAVEQVLFNLLSNAVQAGARRLTVGIGCEPDWGWLTIADDGPGIPELMRSEIFEPFFTTKEAGSGTGLGLYLCRTLLESMHGSIVLEESGPGRTVFRLRLPAADRGSDA